MTTAVVPFLLVYGVSYFFTEFGPNMTTFVMPSELYPVSMRATGHGISAGIGKLGAFIGVFLFPVLNDHLGLRGTLLLTAGVSVAGMLLTLVLPEPAGRSLDEISEATTDSGAQVVRVAS
jgi:PHS family inorganic phosphate transporter-like MFS transporter